MDDGKDKSNIKKATLNPEFFRVFEFPVTMPGESQLKVKVRESFEYKCQWYPWFSVGQGDGEGIT